MRVPIFIVIPLVLAVVLGTWRAGTRHIDFMTPPSESKLAKIRALTTESLVRTDNDPEATAPPEPEAEPLPPPPEPPKPVVDLGDLTKPPALIDYAERASQGALPLIELAQELEEIGEFQRALLAWERVVDLAKPDTPHLEAALAAIQRLRPTLPDWPGTPVKILLTASTGKAFATALAPVLEGAARDLERASAGIVKVRTLVVPGKTSASKGTSPVALWFEGSAKNTPSTDVLSFTVSDAEKLTDETRKTMFALVRATLASKTAYTPPAPLAEGENPATAMHDRITRLCWHEFAAGLNVPRKKNP